MQAQGGKVMIEPEHRGREFMLITAGNLPVAELHGIITSLAAKGWRIAGFAGQPDASAWETFSQPGISIRLERDQEEAHG